MRFVLPTTYARTRLFRPRREAVPLESIEGADVTEVSVAAADGVVLHGWYALSRTDFDGPRPLVLYFPGASGHRGYRTSEFAMFARLGCDMLLVDYRGYGDNQGQPSERNFRRDARAVWRFATNQLQVPPERIVIYGESIGGAVGIRLAADLGRCGLPPAGLVIQAPFTTMLEVVSQYFPWWLAAIFLVDRFPSIRRIPRVNCPLMVIHGNEDRLIPIEMGRRLFAAAPETAANGQPKAFLELDGVDHNDILEEAGDLVEARLSEFLESVLPAEAAAEATTPARELMQPLP